MPLIKQETENHFLSPIASDITQIIDEFSGIEPSAYTRANITLYYFYDKKNGGWVAGENMPTLKTNVDDILQEKNVYTVGISEYPPKDEFRFLELYPKSFKRYILPLEEIPASDETNPETKMILNAGEIYLVDDPYGLKTIYGVTDKLIKILHFDIFDSFDVSESDILSVDETLRSTSILF